MASVMMSEFKVGLPVTVWKYDRSGEADEHVDTGIISNIHYDSKNRVSEVEVECTVNFGGCPTAGQKTWYPLYGHEFIHETKAA